MANESSIQILLAESLRGTSDIAQDFYCVMDFIDGLFKLEEEETPEEIECNICKEQYGYSFDQNADTQCAGHYVAISWAVR